MNMQSAYTQTMPEKPDAPVTQGRPDWEAIELAYKTTHLSLYTLADRFGGSEPTIRRKAKRLGWVRGAAAEKRQVVSDAMAGVTPGLSDDALRQAKEHEASSDIKDMQRGVRIFRDILVAMEKSSKSLSNPNTTPDPREAKVIAETTEKAITSLRIIRGLNPDPPSDKDPEEVDLSNLSLEELRDLESLVKKTESANAPTVQ